MVVGRWEVWSRRFVLGGELATIPPLRDPARRNAARRKRPGHFGRDDNKASESSGPFPGADFWFVYAFGVGVVDAVDDLVFEPFLHVGADGREARDTVDDVDGDVEAIDLIEDGEFERRVDVALFFVAANVNIVVIFAAVAELVDERSVGMEIEDDRLVDGEEGIEIAVGEAVRMFGVGQEAEKIDHIDEANFQVGKMLFENGDGGERFHGGNIAGAGDDDVGFLAIVGGSPIPNANAFGAVSDGVGHGEVLKMVLLVGDDDVDVIAGTQAMIGDAEQAVGVWRKIDACNGGTFVGDDIEEAGILVGEAVVILTPDERSDENVDGRNGSAPIEFLF